LLLLLQRSSGLALRLRRTCSLLRRYSACLLCWSIAHLLLWLLLLWLPLHARHDEQAANARGSDAWEGGEDSGGERLQADKGRHTALSQTVQTMIHPNALCLRVALRELLCARACARGFVLRRGLVPCALVPRCARGPVQAQWSKGALEQLLIVTRSCTPPRAPCDPFSLPPSSAASQPAVPVPSMLLQTFRAPSTPNG